MIDLKCPECGCTIPPDAARCPNCSYKYADNSVKVPPKSNGNGITVSCVGFVTKCEITELPGWLSSEVCIFSIFT